LGILFILLLGLEATVLAEVLMITLRLTERMPDQILVLAVGLVEEEALEMAVRESASLSIGAHYNGTLCKD